MHSFILSLRGENVGVIPPPPGVSPNFIDPPSLQHVVLITNIIFIFVSALFVTLRLYTTGIITRSVGIDDCKCIDLSQIAVSNFLDMIALSWVRYSIVLTKYTPS